MKCKQCSREATYDSPDRLCDWHWQLWFNHGDEEQARADMERTRIEGLSWEQLEAILLWDMCGGAIPTRPVPLGSWSSNLKTVARLRSMLSDLEQDCRNALTFYPELPVDLEMREGMEDCGLISQEHEWLPVGRALAELARPSRA